MCINSMLFSIGEKDRSQYMKSVNVRRGDLHIIDRDNVYEDVLDLYTIGEIIGECPINIKYSGEQAVDDGGVQSQHFGKRPILNYLMVLLF